MPTYWTGTADVDGEKLPARHHHETGLQYLPAGTHEWAPLASMAAFRGDDLDDDPHDSMAAAAGLAVDEAGVRRLLRLHHPDDQEEAQLAEFHAAMQEAGETDTGGLWPTVQVLGYLGY